jgi:hypothetical protein
LVQDNKHQPFLRFIRKVIDVPLGYSKEDLAIFRGLALRDYPALVPLIDEYLRAAERADTDVDPRISQPKSGTAKRKDVQQMHLFDLLRQKRLFPQNEDLSHFAARVLPNLRVYRFDKMSRTDIAGRIIDYLETRDPRTREQLEASMREAMSTSDEKTSDRKSFLSKWERIIKETQL